MPPSEDVRNLAQSFSEAFIYPIIALIFAIGVFAFIWGMVQYIVGMSTETAMKEKGRQHMLQGLLGIVIMAGAYGILNFLIQLVPGTEDTAHTLNL